MPRYVILEHIGSASYKPGRHWDFMIEQGERLRTWELDNIPSISVLARAVPLSDHRLDYLDYEGEVAGDRGTVSQWDCGSYEVILENSGGMVLRLCGQRIQGLLRFVANGGGWLVSFQFG